MIKDLLFKRGQNHTSCVHRCFELAGAKPCVPLACPAPVSTEHHQHPQPQVGDGGPHLRPPVHPPHVPQQLIHGHAQVSGGVAAWTEGMPSAGSRSCQVWEKVCQHVEEVAEVAS